jgi:hypothetical protein
VSGAGENNYRWTYGVRVIANQIDRAKWRNTLTYRFHPRLTAGVEYNPLAKKVSPLANFVAMTETHQRPALIFGTSSDRIGTPSGQSFYATSVRVLSITQACQSLLMWELRMEPMKIAPASLAD